MATNPLRVSQIYEKARSSYQLLGVELGASYDVARARYRQLMRIWHPDISSAPSELAGERARSINDAIDVIRSLSPEQIRQLALLSPQPASHRPRPSRRSPRPSGRSGSHSPHKRPGRDFFGELPITSRQAVAGGRWQLRIPTCRRCGGWGAAVASDFEICGPCQGSGFQKRKGEFILDALCQRCGGRGCKFLDPCKTCGGSGEKTVYVVRCHIPPGFGEGGVGTLPGRGHPGMGGGRAGDLYLRILIQD